MSMEAKVNFLNDIEKSLGDILTVNQTKDVVSILSDMLSKYRLEACEESNLCEDDYIESFLSAKTVEGRTPKTIERYRYLIRRFSAATKVASQNITVFHVRRYFADEKARGISDGTLEGVRQVLSGYYAWLQKEGLIERSPFTNICPIKCQKKVRMSLSDADFERLKSSCKLPRDKAIICFLLSTGCRISEMTQLNRTDVDIHNKECKVLGKGNKERRVYLDDVAAMTLEEYLNSRTDNSPALFSGKGTERLSPHGVRLMLHTVQRDAHIKTNVHPHRFRRTLATNLTHRGMPVQEVARILGHEKLDTTMKYVCLDDREIKYSYYKYM